ncbi:hypothetical protein K461DRAFT_267752 [Myriangium duriaei CBS 260.36]|uniref:F-box domain-containing protein n=1 Tax=Myriangium duriaei CBS 260.36 TaxID=1168546 RepID=A0A9P4J088_9PEZI|nr:hypothetical protein K461DRAFT_267752 [Myriangium duriaei CBS 260.36]
MVSQEPSSTASLDGLPAEILIDILSEVNYGPSLRTDLRLVNRRFKEVTDSYEHCIAGKILASQFAWAPRQFPGLLGGDARGAKKPGWKELATVFHRTAVLTNIKSRCKVIREGRSEHSAWTTCRAITFHHTGLLLLYRLSDCKSHAEKAALIQSLPASSLAVMLFTLMVSVHLLRAIGPSMVLYWTDPPLTEESRSDIELACEEVLLRDGPDFLLGLLMHDMKAIESLKSEVSSMDSKQIHQPTGPPPETTLIASLRQTFAAEMGCEMRYNLVHMWYVLDERCIALSDSNEDVVTKAVEKVVNGEELEVRCGRCRMLEMYGF